MKQLALLLALDTVRQEIVDAATFDATAGSAAGGMEASCPMMRGM